MMCRFTPEEIYSNRKGKAGEGEVRQLPISYASE